MDLTKLTREREQVRRVFNRHEQNAKTKVDLQFLSEKMDKLLTLDKAIQSELLSSDLFNETAYQEECDSCDDFRRRWLQVKNNLLLNFETGEDSTPRNCMPNLNLPKLELQKFDDNPKTWLSFWSQFKKIHESNMDAETKFQYLHQAMEPGSKAKSIVSSYPITEENYKKAITALKERFANEDTLIEIYVRELLLLVTTKNLMSLETLYDKIVTNLQILESLSISKDKYECILLPMIESALPENILLAWGRVTCKKGESRLNNLLTYLKTEVEAESRVTIAKTFFREASEVVPTAGCLVAVNKQVKANIEANQFIKEGKEQCYFCNKFHSTSECSKINILNLTEKRDAIKKKGGCYICLKKGHLAKNCKTFVKCMCCGRRHLLILCPTLHEQMNAPKSAVNRSEVVSSFSGGNSTTLLQTLIIKISGKNKEKTVRALLDSGSQRTYVKTKLAEELNLQVTSTETLHHTLFGGIKKGTRRHRVFKFEVSNLDNTYKTTITGLEENILCGNLPKVQDAGLIEKLKNLDIHLTDADENGAILKDIDVLIGSDYLSLILDNNLVHVTDRLVAVKTKLGWTLQGPVQASHGVYTNIVHTNFVTTIQENMDNSLEFLWNIEALGINDPYNKKKNDTPTDIFSINNEGRYEVPLLWKDGYPKVESNYEVANKRLNNCTNKLRLTGKLNEYHQVFKEWEKEGIIERVDSDNENEGHYLPHHAIFKEDSTTTIRPVFDASSKGKNGVSLNMCIDKGTNLIELIPKLLTLFRIGNYAVISDIRKAFLQISVHPDDRKYLKFLWWNDPGKKDKVLTYQHARIPFGVACSPFLLASTIDYHLEKHANMYPETAMRLKESFYVDNCVTSFDRKEDADNFIKEATELMKEGKFDLRGWMTNSPQEEKAVSVLGVQWDRKRDDLCCNLNLKTVPNNITKRDLLSIAQQIFDPIGYLCPVTLIPKLIIQKAWLLHIGWDSRIPIELEKEYKDWVDTINCLQQCRISRRISKHPLDQCNTTVHVFCDASKNAFSGCVFLRTEHKGEVTVRLVTAKSRVAPIKRQMSLPRLELMGALIASRLFHEAIASGLFSRCKNYKVYCWTDSAVVLAWIQRQDTWKMFVTNRVKEICTNTNRKDWKHLPGSYNPADLPSRGCDSKTLLESRWWTGPEWLYLEEENWPKSIINYTTAEEEIIDSEQNIKTAVNVEIITENFSDRLLYFNQYHKIVRLVARLLRLNPRIRKRHNINSKHISYEEYIYAEKTLIKLIQKESYTDKCNIGKKLLTTIEEGIIKVKTRLDYSGEDKDFIHPILLPRNNIIVQRMVEEKHKKSNHAGTQTLLTDLRNSYWIIGVRRLVKNVLSKCITCRRYKAKHYEVPEPPLPVDRLKSAAPFEVIGVDLAGPLILKNKEKCWIVLFTCAVYRAIHLELTESLSTNSFLMVLRRFIARRGRIKIIYSDNGTNFRGAANLLSEINWQEIEEATNIYKIQWKFTVPAAPWWGGWWERLVRIVKDMLKRILGKASVDWIELSTILCDCEAVINSRPLTYVEMGDVKPLTPMLFLQSLSTNETPDLDEIDENNLQVRYKYLQQLRQDFRTRFKNEYLSLLISKGKENKNEPKVGELVLLEMDKNRLNWPLGIIKEVHKGKDGFTRVAEVQTASGVKVRPYQRLYPLEISTVSQDWLDNIPTTSTAKQNLPEDYSKALIVR